MPLVKTLTGFVTLLLFCSALPAAAQYSASALPLDKLKMPPGFSIDVWAEVPNARGLTLGKNGTVFAGSSSEGNVYAITDTGAAREVKIVASGLNMPIGVAFKDGALYVSAVNRILRFDDIEARTRPVPEAGIGTDTYPSEKHHGGKYIGFGPDNLLYVAVGVPCNICEPADGFALISRIRPDGTGYEVFARGVRNSVGFDWHPATKELWFTDNGRDWMGDNIPPDELNHAPRKDMHFGYPYCHADIPDPKVWREAGLRQAHAAGCQIRAACCPARHAFLYRQHVPAGIPQQYFCCRTRLVEPPKQDRLSPQAGEAEKQQGGQAGGVRGGLASTGKRLGEARRYAGHA